MNHIHASLVRAIYLTVLLLQRDTMAKETLTKKPLTFGLTVPEDSRVHEFWVGEVVGSKQTGMVLEQ